jgi:hypothetical protein
MASLDEQNVKYVEKCTKKAQMKALKTCEKRIEKYFKKAIAKYLSNKSNSVKTKKRKQPHSEDSKTTDNSLIGVDATVYAGDGFLKSITITAHPFHDHSIQAHYFKDNLEQSFSLVKPDEKHSSVSHRSGVSSKTPNIESCKKLLLGLIPDDEMDKRSDQLLQYWTMLDQLLDSFQNSAQ